MGVYSGGRPYGDIYTIPTSAVDNFAARLYNEQKQREAKNVQDAANLDNMFAKNLYGVRDEDVNELSDKFQKYKSGKIALMRSNLKGKERIKADMDNQRDLADLWQGVNGSKADKKTLENNYKTAVPKLNDYHNDTLSSMEKAAGVPSSQLHKLMRADPDGEIDPVTGNVKMVSGDPRNLSNFVNRGQIRRWEPIQKAFNGEPKPRVQRKTPYKDKDGVVMGEMQTPIIAIESPANVYKKNIVLAASEPGVANSFRVSYKDIVGDEKAAQILANYEQDRKDPLVIEAYGEEGLNLPLGDLLDPVKKPYLLYAMDNLNKNKPQLGKPVDMPNKLAMMDKKRKEGKEDWLWKNNITSAQKDRRMTAHNNKTNQTYQIDNVYQIAMDNAEDVEFDVANKLVGGNSKPEKRVYLDNLPSSYKSDILGKNSANKDGSYREYVVVNPDGSFKADKGAIIIPSDIHLATTKRTTPLEKPEGTGKMEIRNGGGKAPVSKPAAKPKKDPLGLGF